MLEFLIYFGLLAAVVTAVTAFGLEMSRSRAKAVAIAEVEQNMRFGMQRILRSVRQAVKVNNGPSVFNSDNGVLSLDVLAASNTPTVFDLSAGAVRIKEGSAAAVPLTAPTVNVTKLRFAKDNLGNNNVAITVEMGVSYATQNTDAIFQYVTTASGTAVVRKN